MNTCKFCGGPLTALFTGGFCPRDCDRKSPALDTGVNNLSALDQWKLDTASKVAPKPTVTVSMNAIIDPTYNAIVVNPDYTWVGIEHNRLSTMGSTHLVGCEAVDTGPDTKLLAAKFAGILRVKPLNYNSINIDAGSVAFVSSLNSTNCFECRWYPFDLTTGDWVDDSNGGIVSEPPFFV